MAVACACFECGCSCGETDFAFAGIAGTEMRERPTLDRLCRSDIAFQQRCFRDELIEMTRTAEPLSKRREAAAKRGLA